MKKLANQFFEWYRDAHVASQMFAIMAILFAILFFYVITAFMFVGMLGPITIILHFFIYIIGIVCLGFYLLY